MKLLYAILFISVIVFFNYGNLEEEFLKYENTKKTVAISLKKENGNEKKKNAIKLRRDNYFELVPPEYETILDTVLAFDPDKYTPEMKIQYEISEESYIEKEGGYKWIIEKEKVNLCNEEDPNYTGNKNETLLKYTKEPDEYGKRKFLTMKIYPTHAKIKNPEKRYEELKRVGDLVKKGKVQQIRARKILKRNGYLKKCSLDDIRKQEKTNKDFLKLKKGCYNISQQEALKLGCEPTLTNIQLALKYIGFDTNTDGKDSDKYKKAKHQFKIENALNNNEMLFLEKLGF